MQNYLRQHTGEGRGKWGWADTGSLPSHHKACKLHWRGLIDPLRAFLCLHPCWFVSTGPKAPCSRVLPTANNAPNVGGSQVFTSYGNRDNRYQVTTDKVRLPVDQKLFRSVNNIQILRALGFQDLCDLEVLGQPPLNVPSGRLCILVFEMIWKILNQG